MPPRVPDLGKIDPLIGYRPSKSLDEILRHPDSSSGILRRPQRGSSRLPNSRPLLACQSRCREWDVEQLPPLCVIVGLSRADVPGQNGYCRVLPAARHTGLSLASRCLPSYNVVGLYSWPVAEFVKRAPTGSPPAAN